MTWIIKMSARPVNDRYVYLQDQTNAYLRIDPTDASRFKTERAASQAIKTYALDAQFCSLFSGDRVLVVVRLADEMLAREATRST